MKMTSLKLAGLVRLSVSPACAAPGMLGHEARLALLAEGPQVCAVNSGRDQRQNQNLLDLPRLFDKNPHAVLLIPFLVAWVCPRLQQLMP